MDITRRIIKVLPRETNTGPNSLICCTFISNQLQIPSNFPLILWLTAYLNIFYFISNIWGLLLIFCFNPLVVRECALYGFKHIRFIETCLAAQNMVCLDKCLMYTWKECTFCFCTVFCKCQLGQVNWQCYSHLICPSCFSLCHLLREESWNFQLSSRICLYFIAFLPICFRYFASLVGI